MTSRTLSVRGPPACTLVVLPHPRRTWITTRAHRRARLRRPQAGGYRAESLHRTTIVKAILIVLDDSCDGMKRIAAIRILSGVLEIKILDRDVIVAKLKIAANRLKVGFLHFLAHAFFIAEIAFDRRDR